MLRTPLSTPSSSARGRPGRRAAVFATAAATVAATALVAQAPAAHAATASGGPGSASSWNEPLGTQGYATAVGTASKVWYMLGNGELTNVYYPETDNPDTYGLQYYVTDGSSFTDDEVTDTTHAITLADPDSLTWTQTNTATSGKYTITKTYVADPARSVILVNTTFTNDSSTPLHLYADYLPQLDNEGAGNSGGTDSTSGDLVARNGTVASALTSSVGFSAASTGYVGTTTSGESQLTTGHSLGSPYSATSSAGHIDQTGEIPVNASGSTTFTLALAFDTTESAAVSDAAASLASGFSSVEGSFQAGWHTWNAGLNAPPNSVTGSGLTQYEVSLMEVKADEDKTYVGAFVASPSTPWGASDSADGGSGQGGQHGYHLVWSRDEYEMATALLAAGDTQDASDALTYMFNYEEESSGQVKQNTWLNGNVMWGGNQEDEEADPIILAYQLGRTDATDYGYVKLLAQWIAKNGPTTQEERWEENGGYSPATIATEIAGLVCASSLATSAGDSADAASWLALAKTWASDVAGWTYTTTGPYGGGDYFLRLTPDGQPNSGATIGLANGGGTHDDRAVVDQSFLELVRLGVMASTNTDITNTLAVTDVEIGVQTPEGQIDHRYDFDGYGESSSGADYTGAGTGNPWPVLTGERGEYDVAAGNLAGAASALATMAGAASNYQISEQVWGGASGVNGFTAGKPDNSATPLMWPMAQYVRLAIDISAGTDVDTPQVVCQTFGTCSTVSQKPPPAPTNLAVTATKVSSVSLSWSGSAQATGYQLYRSTGGGSPTLLTTTTSDTYTDSGLESSTAYTYYLIAVNGYGSSPESASVTATTLAPGTPPAAPTGLATTVVGSTSVSLSWNPSVDTAGTVAGYDVYRSTGGGAATLVGTTAGTTFIDNTVAASTTYQYDVTAFDTIGDVSTPSGTLNVTTGADNVETVFVTVPADTAATGATVYLAGTLSALGIGTSSTDWAANGVALTKVSPTLWETTLTSANGPTTLTYKYTLGGAWANNEETSSCGYVGNRTMAVNGGTENDTVANWEGVGSCPGSPPSSASPSPSTSATPTASPSPSASASASPTSGVSETFNVTVPSSTPSGGKVYLAGDLSALGEGQADWAANGVLMTQVSTTLWTVTIQAAAPATLQYKYTLNGNWSNNEETSSCAYVGNRSVNVDNGTENDTVARWEGYGGC